jgi:serine/threonine protein phosphatase PrpC
VNITAQQLRRPSEAEIDVHGVTHQGLVRGRNEDHFLIGSVGRTLRVLQTSVPDMPELSLPELPEGERSAFMAVVADGVGGASRGEEAARVAVQTVTQFIAAGLHGHLTQLAAADDGGDGDDGSEDAFISALADAARRSHAELRRLAADGGSPGMATTLTLWFGLWPRAYVLQVGDSRAYLFHDGRLTQVSRDQTVAEELVQQGVLSRVQAEATRWAHLLSSALGGPTPAPVVTPMLLHWDSVHLLCSDGLTKHVTDEQIRERLATMTSARQVCEALLQDALDGGGTDNITVIVGRAVPGGGGQSD